VTPDGSPGRPTPPPPGPAPSDPDDTRRVWFGIARSTSDRVIAGVAAGIAHRLGVDPVLVRIAFAVLAFAGGSGIIAYGLLWALLPSADDTRVRRRRPATVQQGVALGLITLGVLLFLRSLGLWFGDTLVIPIVIVAAGSAIVWTRGDEQERARWNPLTGGGIAAAASAPVSPWRIVGGTLLVTLGLAGFLAANDALTALRDLGIALIAALVGVGLLFGPWLWRLWDQLGAERRERIRQEERAELAAHLHDSVLQTLALIQRSADQPRRMVALARRQERELRSWLYGSAGQPGQPVTLEDAVTAVIEDIEATHDLAVEVVVVGDTTVDEHVTALLAALREAATNAAKHADVDEIDVYVEVDRTEVLAFVRDRGRGFDPTDVPPDRQGLRRSIVDRLERHGGRATIVSSPGDGTEIELAVPCKRRATPESTPGSPTDPASHPAPPPPPEVSP
jgi:signal transduction histidine kinase